MPPAKPPPGTRTLGTTRQPLADITPPAESGAMDTSADASETEPKECRQTWDSLCVSKNCPIAHPHNFGLRPPTHLTPLTIFTDADALIINGDDTNPTYPDTEPPPLIKAMINTLRHEPPITNRYPYVMDILRDFYRVHGGRSDKYHGPGGMFGLGMDVGGRKQGYGVGPYHKLPDKEGEMGGWFAFETEESENEKGGG